MKKRTIKQEARYYLQCQGHDATDQEIQRGIWRERKNSGRASGWSVASYLKINKIAKPIDSRQRSF